jgi:hypothetical protein
MYVRIGAGKQETYLLLSVSIRYRASRFDRYFQLKFRRCTQGLIADKSECH